MNATTTREARTATRRPTPDAVHADLVACQAARRARLNGADTAQAASVYAATYAAAMRGER